MKRRPVGRPSFTEEKARWDQGERLVAGIDEAGRGPLAGPVVAAALILPVGFSAEWCHSVADSKFLTPRRREELDRCIRATALGIGVGIIDAATIDLVGIARATRLAMQMAVAQLKPQPEYLLIDYLKLPEVRLPQKGVTNGDSLCFSIACASIIAKVARDRLMVEIDRLYPGYRFADHKGYGTPEHMVCLHRLGPSPVHRRSFRPVREFCGGDLP